MDNIVLNEILLSKVVVNNHEVIDSEWEVEGLSFLKLRDILIVKGKVLFEDLDQQVYVAAIRGGWLKLNTSYLAFHLCNEKLQIAAIADEGVFKQHTSEGALNELRKSLDKYIKE